MTFSTHEQLRCDDGSASFHCMPRCDRHSLTINFCLAIHLYLSAVRTRLRRIFTNNITTVFYKVYFVLALNINIILSDRARSVLSCFENDAPFWVFINKVYSCRLTRKPSAVMQIQLVLTCCVVVNGNVSVSVGFDCKKCGGTTVDSHFEMSRDLLLGLT